MAAVAGKEWAVEKAVRKKWNPFRPASRVGVHCVTMGSDGEYPNMPAASDGQAAEAARGGVGAAGGEGAGLLGYASGMPRPAEAGGGAGEAYREGPTLIALHGTTLPARCILCGGAGFAAPIRLTLTWDASFRLTRVSTPQLRQKAAVHAYLCAGHRRVWARARRIGVVGATAGMSLMSIGLALGVWSESSDIPAYTPLGIGLTLAGFAVVTAALFYFTLRSRTLTCRRIQEGYVYLEGAAGAFLEGLPELPAAGGR